MGWILTVAVALRDLKLTNTLPVALPLSLPLPFPWQHLNPPAGECTLHHREPPVWVDLCQVQQAANPVPGLQ